MYAHTQDVIFPEPIDQWTSEFVLTETLETGTPISEFMHDGVTAESKKLAKIGLRAFLKMVFLVRNRLSQR